MEITTQRKAELVSDAWFKGCDGVWGSLGALGTPGEVRRSRSPPGKMAQHSWASAPRRPGFPWCEWAACHTEQRGWDAAPGAGGTQHPGDTAPSAWDARRLAESWSSRTRKARNTGSRDPRAPTRGRFLFPGAFLCFPHQACFPFILRGRKPHRCNKRNTKRNSHPLGHSAVSIRSSACLNSILHLTRKPKCSSLLFTEVW